MKFTEVIIDGKVRGYAKNPTITNTLLPNGTIKGVGVKNGSRILSYSGGEVAMLREVSKEIGVYSGNVCQICEIGALQDQGGCATCSNCGAQLKCGL